MDILLCTNQLSHLLPLMSSFSEADGSSIPFTKKHSFLQHQIYICELGYGGFQTTYKLTKILQHKKFHLVIEVALCNSYKAEIKTADIVNVIKNKLVDFGKIDHDEFKDLYDLNFLNADEEPHKNKAFINMNNSYMNVFLPYKKVVAITVNTLRNISTVAFRTAHYKTDIESSNGLFIAYPCLFEKQPFYQIYAVEENLVLQDCNTKLALQNLNAELLSILKTI